MRSRSRGVRWSPRNKVKESARASGKADAGRQPCTRQGRAWPTIGSKRARRQHSVAQPKGLLEQTPKRPPHTSQQPPGPLRNNFSFVTLQLYRQLFCLCRRVLNYFVIMGWVASQAFALLAALLVGAYGVNTGIAAWCLLLVLYRAARYVIVQRDSQRFKRFLMRSKELKGERGEGTLLQ